jgi:nucleotide-binding universal stress UspA family protein
MKVLLATDGSDYSEGAAKFLTRLNFSAEDEIFILHVISWVPIVSEWGAFYDNFKEIRDEVVPKILDEAADIVKQNGAKISTSFKEDYPDKAIIDTAAETGADLIVMGARGIKGIGSHIIGSVTKLVAIKADKPVLIINPPQKAKTAPIKVLFATDGSSFSDATGKVLASIPFPDDTELTLLNVMPTAFEDIPERFALEINDRIKNIVAGTRGKEIEASAEILDKAYKELNSTFLNIKKIAKVGDPSEVILQEAESADADIIAVGTSGMRGVKGMIGSASRYVLNHAKCSVLIARK